MRDQPLSEEPRCGCGARLAEGEKHCGKCRARNRWLRCQNGRRKAQRRSTRRPGGARRPAARPDAEAVAA